MLTLGHAGSKKGKKKIKHETGTLAETLSTMLFKYNDRGCIKVIK